MRALKEDFMRYSKSSAIIILSLFVLVALPLRAQVNQGPTCTYTGKLTASGKPEVSVLRLTVPGASAPLVILAGSTVAPAVMSRYLNSNVSVRAKRIRENGAEIGIAVSDIFPAMSYDNDAVGSGCMHDLEGDANYPSVANAISTDGSVIVGRNIGGHAWKYAAGRFTDLGTLGGPTSEANAVSSDGSVIVGVADTTGSPHAFRYADGHMSDLGVLSNFTRSRATGVTADGSVIVGTSDYVRGGNIIIKQSWRYTNGVMQQVGFDNLEALGVSGDGSTIVGKFYTRDQDFTDSFIGFMLRNGNMTRIGDFGEAVACSRDGSIIVGTSGQYKNRYHNGQASSMGSFVPTAITPDGSVVVGVKNGAAVKYSNGQLKYLGLLGCKLDSSLPQSCDLRSTSWATGVSSDGKRIVGHSSSHDGTVHPFLYEEE